MGGLTHQISMCLTVTPWMIDEAGGDENDAHQKLFIFRLQHPHPPLMCHPL